ncbi:MAG: alpha/beta hydrolase family protein [Gordonia sp. (in: high G+C Gram-positive bacteria)]
MRSLVRAPARALAAVLPILLSALLVAPGHAEAKPQRLHLMVYSAAMGREIPVDVLTPAGGGPAPTLYLLNGASGGEDDANWFDQGDVTQITAGKHVNVVVPMAGAFSYYTDWLHDDPSLGRQRWETFLTRELPPVIAGRLSTNGRNAIAGLSMSGSAALALAERVPGLYRGVASFSGCPNTSGVLGSTYVRLTVEGRGAGSVTNMWGPVGGPAWLSHDAELGAGRLRGKDVFVSAGPGLPGRHDNTANPQKVQQMLVGGPIEAAVRACSEQFVTRLHQLGIGVTTYFPATGTHSFAYWNDALRRAWPVLSRHLY